MTELILKKGKEKSLLRRHPWVYDTAVERAVGNPKAGDTVKGWSISGLGSLFTGIGAACALLVFP